MFDIYFPQFSESGELSWSYSSNSLYARKNDEDITAETLADKIKFEPAFIPNVRIGDRLIQLEEPRKYEKPDE